MIVKDATLLEAGQSGSQPGAVWWRGGCLPKRSRNRPNFLHSRCSILFIQAWSEWSIESTIDALPQTGACESQGSNEMHTQCSHQFALFIALRMTRIPNGRGQGLGWGIAVPLLCRMLDPSGQDFQGVYARTKQAAGLGKSARIANTKNTIIVLICFILHKIILKISFFTTVLNKLSFS